MTNNQDSERARLRQQAKRMGIEVRRGATKDEIDEAISARFRADHEAIRNWNKR